LRPRGFLAYYLRRTEPDLFDNERRVDVVDLRSAPRQGVDAAPSFVSAGTPDGLGVDLGLLADSFGRKGDP
jgi:hypothetical protein